MQLGCAGQSTTAPVHCRVRRVAFVALCALGVCLCCFFVSLCPRAAQAKNDATQQHTAVHRTKSDTQIHPRCRGRAGRYCLVAFSAVCVRQPSPRADRRRSITKRTAQTDSHNTPTTQTQPEWSRRAGDRSTTLSAADLLSRLCCVRASPAVARRSSRRAGQRNNKNDASTEQSSCRGGETFVPERSAKRLSNLNQPPRGCSQSCAAPRSHTRIRPSRLSFSRHVPFRAWSLTATVSLPTLLLELSAALFDSSRIAPFPSCRGAMDRQPKHAAENNAAAGASVKRPKHLHRGPNPIDDGEEKQSEAQAAAASAAAASAPPQPPVCTTIRWESSSNFPRRSNSTAYSPSRVGGLRLCAACLLPTSFRR